MRGRSPPGIPPLMQAGQASRNGQRENYPSALSLFIPPLKEKKKNKLTKRKVKPPLRLHNRSLRKQPIGVGRASRLVLMRRAREGVG